MHLQEVGLKNRKKSLWGVSVGSKKNYVALLGVHLRLQTFRKSLYNPYYHQFDDKIGL